MQKIVVVFSGGMDSAVLLAQTVTQYTVSQVHSLTFFYGSKHMDAEIRSAKAFASSLGVEHTVVDLTAIGKYFQSSLLSHGEIIPEGTYATDNMASTVVPFRNGIFLAFAVGFAESKGFDSVFIGSHAGDHPVYPDCRPEFTEAFSKAASFGTAEGITVSAPFAKISKADIARIGADLRVDFSQTWTCYNGGEVHCGRCAACHERREALETVLGMDPTTYLS